jgi:DNA-binding HxlR family transcriptional regulator
VSFQESYCASFQHGIEVIGRRWTGAILQVMLGGATRYSDIRDSIPGLTDRLLSDRLRELEAEGILERVVLPEVPVCIRYHLTEKGRELVPIIETIQAWSSKWAAQPAASSGDRLISSP